MENFVAIALASQEKELKFWRTKNKVEIDFISEKEGKLTAFEVKAGKETYIPSPLRSFVEKYSPKRSFVLNDISSPEKKLRKTRVSFLPYWKSNSLY